MGIADHRARTGVDPVEGYDQAAHAFDQVLATNAKDVLGYLYRAQVQRKIAVHLAANSGRRESERLVAAMRDLDAAVAIDAGQIQVRIERARVAVTLASWTQNLDGLRNSLDDFARAVQEVRGNAHLWSDYSRVLIQLQQFDDAVRLCYVALQHIPRHPRLLELQRRAQVGKDTGR